MSILGRYSFCIYVLIGIIVVSNALSVEPIPNLSRSRRQSDQPTGRCKRPDKPKNGNYLIIPSTSVDQETLPLHTVLTYSCNKGYKLSRETKLLVCLEDGWSQEPLTCLKTCAPLYNTPSTNVTCLEQNGREVECDQAKDGTEARFSCAKFYEPTQKNRRSIYCRDGTWDLPPLYCTPVCGRKSLSAQPLAVQTVEAGSHPWVASIFRKTDTGVHNICGGPILSPKIILTAAHCVSDHDNQAIDPANFTVGVGKQYSKYQDQRDHNAQYSDIEKIVIHPRYKGESQRYSSDIAFLVSKDTLALSSFVQPVCFGNLPDIHLNNGLTGEIAGWSFPTTGNTLSSEEIIEIPLLYKDDATCRSELPIDFMDNYYTYDKICAGYYDDGTVPCPKPSGKGLVFKNPEDGRFYVHGILSLGPNLQTSRCKTATTSLYTKVAQHYDMLERIVSQYGL